MKLTKVLMFALMASACLLMPILFAAPASAQALTFIQIGDREQECPASESVEYKWFLYNDYDTSLLVQVNTNVSSGSGWTSAIDQPILVLDYMESVIITLTLSASKEVTSKAVNQSVSFAFRDLNNTLPSFTQVGFADTELIPVWGVLAPGKNKLLGNFDNPFPAPFDSNYVTFVLNMAIWAVIALFVAYVVDPIVHMMTRKTKSDIDDRILKILRKPIFVLIIVFGLVSSLTILPLTEREVATVFEFYAIALIAIVTFVAYKIFKEVLIYIGKRWASRTSTEIDDVLIPVIDKIGGIVILVFGALGALTYMGYDITFLLAGVGVFGLVIAFAAQDALSNFFSGIMLLLDRPFTEGDYVTLPSGEICRVERVGIRSTRLYDTFSNNQIVLPNNKIVNEKLVNLTEPTNETIHEITVSVVYGSDVNKVEKLITDIATKHKEVLKDTGKEPSVRFNAFGESGMEFKLYFWVADFMTKYRVAHELRKEIEKRFTQEKIEFSYPARTVFIREAPKK